MSSRLELALEAGDLTLPETGMVAVLHPRADTDLSILPRDRLVIVQPMKPDHDRLFAEGFACVATLDDLPVGISCAVVCIPRAKTLARDLIAQAAERASELLIVDGAKSDGADSLLKEVRKRTDIGGPISKAHGKLFWLQPEGAVFADWVTAPDAADGFVTAPGVFSYDGVDPASAMLASAVPAHVGRRVADLGAGWGYLSHNLLRDSDIETLHLVEANHIAIECARRNINDSRARFHWADALDWRPDGNLDAVVMNPPFHTARSADVALGQDFVRAAARVLCPSGALWMVANRHLPYEAVLTGSFAEVREIAGDARFKVIRAARPLASAAELR